MYKIYINITPKTRIDNYQTSKQKELSEKLEKSMKLYEEGKITESILLNGQVKNQIEELKNMPQLGVVKKDFSAMKMFYIVNTDDLSDSFYYIPYFLDRNPLKEEHLSESVTLEDFIKKAEKISKKVKLTNKKSDEVWFEGDCLYQLDSLLLTRNDNIINLEIADKDSYDIEFGESIDTDYDYETIYEQLCTNIKSDGLDIKGEHI